MVPLVLAYAAGVALTGGGTTAAFIAVVHFALAVVAAPRAALILGVAALAGALSKPSDPRCAAEAAPDASETVWTGFALDHPSARARPTDGVRFRTADAGPCDFDVEVHGLEEEVGAGRWASIRGRWEAPRYPTASPVFVATELRSAPPGARVTLRVAGALAQVRATLEGDLRRLLPERAPLLLAFLFARRSQLDPDIRDGFLRTGTAHLLAISGFHIGVVASVVVAAATLMGLGVRGRAAAAAIFCWLYVAGLGFPRPAVRATVLLTAVAGSRLLGRPTRPLGALASALLVFLVLDREGLASAGTQLTFAATGGILLLRGPIERLLRAFRFAPGSDLASRLASGLAPKLAPIRGAVAVSLAATLPTIPLLGWHFGTVSWMSVPATLVLTPFVSISVTGGVLLLTVARFVPAAATALAGGVDAALLAVEYTLAWLSEVPAPSLVVSRAGAVGVGIGMLSGLLWARFGSHGGSTTVRAALAAMITVSGSILGPLAADVLGRGRLEVHMLDVGQGDATLIRSPAGRWVLVDAGPRGRSFDAGERRVLPYLRASGVRRLDRLVLTHADLDHIGGAPAVLDGIDVHVISDPGDAKGSAPYIDVLHRARTLGVPWHVLEAGDTWELDGVEFEVLAPPPDDIEGGALGGNERSLIILVRFGSFEALLTGDAPVEAERQVLSELPTDLELLKVGHHGSLTSTAPELLARTRPHLAVVSAGRRNRYGHPAPEVVDRLVRSGARILRTDQAGSIRITAWDSGRFRVYEQYEADDLR